MSYDAVFCDNIVCPLWDRPQEGEKTPDEPDCDLRCRECGWCLK